MPPRSRPPAVLATRPRGRCRVGVVSSPPRGMTGRLDPHRVDLRVGIGLEDDVVIDPAGRSPVSGLLPRRPRRGWLDPALLTASISAPRARDFSRSHSGPGTKSPPFPRYRDFWGHEGARTAAIGPVSPAVEGADAATAEAGTAADRPAAGHPSRPGDRARVSLPTSPARRAT